MSARFRRTLLIAVVFGGAAGFYWGTFTFRGITDTRLNSLQTRALVRHGDVDVARYGIDEDRFFVLPRDGHLYSIYGVGVSVVAAPIYAPLMAAGVSDAGLEGAVGIVFAAGTVTAMYVLLARHFSRSIAVAGTTVLGFGTTLWPLAANAFWQQAPVMFFLTLGIAAFLSDKPRAPLWSGLALGTAAFVRPSLAVLMLFVAFAYYRTSVRALGTWIAGAVVPMAGILIQNRWIWGSWFFGGYSYLGVGFSSDLAGGLFGEMLGFWRGLLVYSPVLAMGYLGWFVAMERADETGRRLAHLGAGTVLLTLMYAGFRTWWGGENQFGYRYLLDVVPCLIVLGCYAVARKPRLATLAIPLGVISILTATFGTAPHRAGWDIHAFTGSFVRSPVGQAWIAFFDNPSGGLIRLGGVALLAGFLWIASKHVAEPATAHARLPG